MMAEMIDLQEEGNLDNLNQEPEQGYNEPT